MWPFFRRKKQDESEEPDPFDTLLTRLDTLLTRLAVAVEGMEADRKRFSRVERKVYRDRPANGQDDSFDLSRAMKDLKNG